MDTKHNVAFQTVQLFTTIAQVLAPPPILTVSQWADQYRKLSPESAAEPGQWNTSRAEFQRAIMDAINDPVVSDIIIQSSSQVGKTEILLNIIGYFIDYDASPILVIQPTIVMGETFSKERLAPMIRDTPALRGKVKEARAKNSENTILHKKFPGGHITIAGANSPASLASRPIRVVLCDEVDRFPASAGAEGDPVKLAEKRTTAFWNRKKIKVSTPTLEGFSKIEKEFKKGSQEEWCVKCPCCGTYQPYSFKRLLFDTLKMKCLSCDATFTEQEWKAQPHQWIATNPKQRRVKSYHLNELASPWKHWDEIVEEFLEAQEDYKKTGSTNALITFINTSLGETWREKGEGVDAIALLSRREHYISDLPDGVLVLTAGVDVQEDRLEVEVVGWANEYESWGIYRFIFRGNPERDAVWGQLEELYHTEFSFPDGNCLTIAAMCVDTGGHYTNRVYRFIKEMQAKFNNIYGIKGYSNTPGIPLIYKKTKVEIKNLKGRVMDTTSIFILGVDAGKEDIISRLKLKEIGAGYCHFPDNEDRGYDQTYMEGLTAEEKVVRMVNNKMKITWVKKPGVRNEPLDLRNYAYAAVCLLSPNWNILRKKIEQGLNYMNPAQKTVKKKRRRVSKGVEI